MTLAETIAGSSVGPGELMLWWLGGTGFVLKTPGGAQIFIDPYFSNCVAAIFGVERAFAPPIRAEEARPDLVLATHWHEDHLDPEGLPILARHSAAQFLAPPSCVSRLLGWGIARSRVQSLAAGQSREFGELRLTAVPARHQAGLPGWECEDAIGLLIDVAGLRLYHSGDTEYDLRLRALAFEADPPIDACMLVINGAGGNMNAHEAALLGWQLGPQTLIPMHHVLWQGFTGGPQATLDPELFRQTYQRLGGKGSVHALAVGQGLRLRARREVDA